MKLKLKLPLVMVLIGLIPALLVAFAAYFNASSAIYQNKFDQLSSLSEVKRSSVVRYLTTIRDQVGSMARNASVVDSLQAFEAGFQTYAAETALSESQDTINQLAGYYNREFISRLKDADPRANIGAGQLTKDLNLNTLALQKSYIVENPNQTGEKHLLEAAPEQTTYNQVHGQNHSYFRDYLERFGYYDIFLINLQGDIIYSVFKEIDYATSLKNGPYSDSGLAAVFNEAMNLSASDGVALVDFKTYVPSYNAPAAFIAAPVFDGSEKIGVIAFQFPIDSLNGIMTEREGLGETGETYLVGSDLLMRSDSYLDPENHTVNASFRRPETGTVDTEAVRDALGGSSQTKVIIDYNGNPVLSSFRPLGFDQLDWVILAEIDEAEILGDVISLRNFMIIIILIATGIVVGVAVYIVKSILKPLGGEPAEMAEIAQGIAEGDLSVELDDSHATGLYQSIISMTGQLKKIVSDISSAAMQQASAAEQLSAIAVQTSQTINNQQQSTQQVAAAMNEMSASVNEVSGSTSSASENAKSARSDVRIAGNQVKESASDVQALSEELTDAQGRVVLLKEKADSIAGIMTTINGIADQTNLLALNAAIEAARAGEQGRGFAVVADEVRSLAQSTQKSSAEISEMIDTLLQGTQDASSVMARCVERMVGVSTKALETANNLQLVVGSVEQIDDSMVQIASAAEQQTSVASEISTQIEEINNMSSETSLAAEQIATSTSELARLSHDLKGLVGHFKTS